MGSTYLSLHYHIIFGTKERRPFMAPNWRDRLHEYLGGTVRGLGGVPDGIGGVADHVHLLVGLRATHCLANFVREVKKASSIWSCAHGVGEFAWQEGYAAFTISVTSRPAVRGYIARQAEHHRKMTFREEMAALLQKAGVDYDPKYLE